MRTTATLNQIIAEWLTNSDIAITTRKDYRQKIELWFRYLAAVGVEPREPSRSHLLEYKQHLQSIGKSQYTINGYLTIVKLFYRYCATQKYYENIGTGIKSSTRFKEHKRSPLTRSEAQRLLGSIDSGTIIGKRDKLIIALMLTNGLRTCEVGRIDVEDFAVLSGRQVLYIQRKGRADKREVVAITDTVARLRDDYLVYHSCSGAMFLNHTHHNAGRLVRLTIGAMIKRRLAAIGISRPDISAHSLRHTCGSLLVESGVPIESIRDLLGHSDSATTRIYIDMAQRRQMLENSPSNVIDKLLCNKG